MSAGVRGGWSVPATSTIQEAELSASVWAGSIGARGGLAVAATVRLSQVTLGVDGVGGGGSRGTVFCPATRTTGTAGRIIGIVGAFVRLTPLGLAAGATLAARGARHSRDRSPGRNAVVLQWPGHEVIVLELLGPRSWPPKHTSPGSTSSG